MTNRVHGTVASRKDVEAAVRADLQVHRIRDAAGEIGHYPGDGVEASDPVATEVREEVVADEVARKLHHRRIVEGAAGNRAACGRTRAVSVGEERTAKTGIGGRAFGGGPTVVGSCDAVVDLLPGVLPDVVDEEAAGTGLHREGERVA